MGVQSANLLRFTMLFDFVGKTAILYSKNSGHLLLIFSTDHIIVNGLAESFLTPPPEPSYSSLTHRNIVPPLLPLLHSVETQSFISWIWVLFPVLRQRHAATSIWDLHSNTQFGMFRLPHGVRVATDLPQNWVKCALSPFNPLLKRSIWCVIIE